MKTICIYHSRDLDGWMSAAIVKKWWVEDNKKGNLLDMDTCIVETTIGEKSLTFLGWDYGDEMPNLEKYDKVIMCDISFPKDKMMFLFNKFDNNLIYIDHHISAIINIIGKNHIKENGEVIQTLFNGLLNTKYAACELTWKYFFPNKNIPEIVRLLGMYDSFRHKGTDEEQKILEFQYAARMTMTNYSDCYKYLKKYDNEPSNYEILMYQLSISGKAIYSYLKQEAKQIYNKAFEIKFKTPKLTTVLARRKGLPDRLPYFNFLCVNQERFNPINFDIDYHKEGYDGFACFWYNKGKWTFSLYSEQVDVSIIAKQYSGGDHKGAAGFICDNETMLKVISNAT